MKLTQNWIGYLDRSYQQVKQSVLSRLPVNNPELTDLSEGNPLITLVGIFSGIAEMLNLYIDATARECFIGTLRQYTSALKLVRLLDYRIQVSNCPSVDLLFTLLVDGTPTPYSSTITIPAGTQVDAPSNSTPFYTTKDVDLLPGYTEVRVPAKSYSVVTGYSMGTSTGMASQVIALPLDIATDSTTLLVAGDTWFEYKSFAFMNPYTKGFVIDVLSDGNPYLILGDGINGAIPPISTVLEANFRTTVGTSGNLPPSSITSLQSSITLPSGYVFDITNPDYSSGGTFIQGLESIRNLAPRFVRTLERAVTPRDYEDLAILAPGVGSAVVDYCCCCAVAIQIYILPYTRGIATSELLGSTYDYLETKKIIGRRLYIKPAGITRLYLDLGIVAYPGFTITPDVMLSVILALNSAYGYNGTNTEINTTILPSRIIRLLTDIQSVESVSINRIYLQPYCSPWGLNELPLVITWDDSIGIASTIKIIYKLHYNGGAGNFTLYKNTLEYATITIGTPYNDGTIMGFTIGSSSSYVDSMEWVFTVFPSYPEVFANYQLEVDDNSEPIVDVDFTTITSGIPAIFGNISITSSSTETSCPTC